MFRHSLCLVMMLGAALFGLRAFAEDKPKTERAASSNLDSMSPATQEYLRRMMSPDVVTGHVRNTLRAKMKKHGGDWKRIPTAAVLLHYAEVETFAQDIVNQPRIAEDVGQIAGLGDAFFILQEELRTRARALKDAAAAKDPKAVAASMGQVADTCATCHAIYRGAPEGK